MNKTIEINGVTFEVQKPLDHNPATRYRTLDMCYSKCSDTKQEIWRDWFTWLRDASDYNFEMWVGSYNCNFFTISAVATINGQRYFFYITHAHNRVSVINA